MTKSSTTLLIDASIYIFQYYFSLPDHWFSQKASWPTAAVYGYTTFLIRLLAEQKPKRIAACFDESLDQCFRNTIYPHYKCSRALPDEALAFQLKACRRVTELLGIRSFGSNHYEADDLLGSLYTRQLRSTQAIGILTRDKDLGQLLKRPQDFLWDYAAKAQAGDVDKNSSNNAIGQQHYMQDITDKFGVKPHQLVDYLALVGDSIDDIPGVPGIGKKTAQVLLQHFDSLQALFAQRSEVAALPIRGAKTIGSKLMEYQEQILMAQKLATIVTDLEITQNVSDITRQEPSWQALKKFCREMGFPRLYSRFELLR